MIDFRNTLPLLAAAFLAGCVASAPEPKNVYQGLQSEDPVVRGNAVLEAGNTRNEKTVPLLIDRLSDQASEVRMLANLALIKITGEDFGYKPWDTDTERWKAIQRWREWYNQTHPGRHGNFLKLSPEFQPATAATQPAASQPATATSQPA